MKNFRTILSTIVVASFILISCGQNSNKQKEIELKERELALKEKELAVKEKRISGTDPLVQKTTHVPNNPTNNPTPKPKTANSEPVSNNVEEKYLGCWYWGTEEEGFAILEVKPNGVLIINRLDLNQKQIAGYKIVRTKIVFTNNRLLMGYECHIERTKNDTYIVEETPDSPGRFKKIDCK